MQTTHLFVVLCLVTFCFAGWDITMYEQSSGNCDTVDQGCQVCTSSTGAKISIKLACEGDEALGVSPCTTEIYTTSDCTGGIFSTNSIINFADLNYDSDECAYLKANTLTGSCNFVATPKSYTIAISASIIAVTLVLVVVIIAGTAFLIQRKRKSAHSTVPTYDE